MILPLNIKLQLLNILNPCSTSFLSIIQSKLRLTTFNILKMWAPDIVAIAFQNKSLLKKNQQQHTLASENACWLPRYPSQSLWLVLFLTLK